jgi:hypothetical protein
MATQVRRVNMAIRELQQQQPAEAVLSALMSRGGLSRRQAYRYLRQARGNLRLRPAPEPKAVFTVNLPRRLIGAVRERSRRQNRPISHLVAEVLERWLEQTSPHG